MEPVPVDPVAEWAAAGGETGLEEPMWQLGLGSGPESYPERPDEPNCIYYLKTGFCGYGNRCRFNHPRDRAAMGAALRSAGGEYPERVGQPVCQHYMRTGMCRFGASCKYHHPKQGAVSSAPVLLNFYGYPLRPGEKECSYYLKTGQCKFGVTCKFHHPQPGGAPPVPELGPTPLPAPTAMATPSGYPTLQSPSFQSSQQYGLMQGNWPIARPPMLPGSYVPGSYGPVLIPPAVVPVPGWTPYPDYMVQAPATPTTQPTVGSVPAYGVAQFSPSAYLSAIPSSSIQRENPFPERPGQPECQYYLRTGDCKFGSACKYHHPPEWIASKASFVLSPMGLPLRPGAPLCSHYAQNGVCRFGPSCKYDHPMRISYSPSASSLTDMPVAPYPVGSTHATLAPSSSSSDLRPELLSGASKDTFQSQMNSSSASVGSLFSSSEAVVTHSSVAQLSGTVSSAETEVTKSS